MHGRHRPRDREPVRRRPLRCTMDQECGDPTSYGCVAPLPATPGTGNVCRARFTDSIVGVRAYADQSDRWVSSRRI